MMKVPFDRRKTNMSDVETDMDALAGENMAFQAILVGLMLHLQRAGMGHAVEGAFTYADSILDILAVKIDGQGRPAHFRKALQVVDALREAVLSDHGDPKQGV